MLLLVDKPTGMTSYDVIRRLKHVFPGQKIGHSGTLDPLATGLLILGIGKDTKRLGELQGLEKTYEADMTFQSISDTWDSDFRKDKTDFDLLEQEGNVGILKDDVFVSAPVEDKIKAVLDSLLESARLPLPPFSAKKKEGKKLYELARKGKPILIEKDMKVLSIEILNYDFPNLTFSTKVGSGTYIRSIAYWLGLQLGLGGIISSLRRTSIGEFDVRDAKTLDDILSAKI